MQAHTYSDGDTSDLVESGTFHASKLGREDNGLPPQVKAVIMAYAFQNLPERGSHRKNAEAKLEIFAAKDPLAEVARQIRRFAETKPSSEEELIRADRMLQVLHAASLGIKTAQAAARSPY